MNALPYDKCAKYVCIEQDRKKIISYPRYTFTHKTVETVEAITTFAKPSSDVKYKCINKCMSNTFDI